MRIRMRRSRRVKAGKALGCVSRWEGKDRQAAMGLKIDES